MTTHLRIILALLILLSGCGLDEQTPQAPKLVDIINANPTKDAELAFANGDYQFIRGHNHDPIPPQNIPECLVETWGSRELSNESFAYGSYDFQRYGALAELYANWYNYTMWEKLEAQGLSDC